MTTLTRPATANHSEAAILGQRFEVVGMTCSHCEHAIAAEVSALPGVTAVTADAAAGTVIIQSDRELDRIEVASAVAEAGYELAR
jgi:copper chaperone CopZ